MSQLNTNDNEVDIVIGALHSDLKSFMNEWNIHFMAKNLFKCILSLEELLLKLSLCLITI